MCLKYTLGIITVFTQIINIFLILRVNKYTCPRVLLRKKLVTIFIKTYGMKKYIWAFCFSMSFMQLIAQTNTNKNSGNELFAFTITDYIVPLSDNLIIVQVKIPTGSNVQIENVQMGLLRRNYANDNKDTAAIGWGKCHLIKGDYYYFSMHLYNNNKKPQPNDLLLTRAKCSAVYKGKIFGLVKNAIYFEHTTGGNFFDFYTPLTASEKSEKSIVDSLVADIQFTGRQMIQQKDAQDMTISGGMFNGKKLFSAMMDVTANNVTDFLDYVLARPQKYAGNTWKISETFATWMTSGTPTVKRN